MCLYTEKLQISAGNCKSSTRNFKGVKFQSDIEDVKQISSNGVISQIVNSKILRSDHNNPSIPNMGFLGFF